MRHPAAACGVVGFKPTLRLGAARRLHALRAELRHRRRDRAQRAPRRRIQHAVISAAPPADLAGGLDGLRIAFLGGYFTARLEDDVAAMLERARGRVRAGEIDIGWSQDDNRSMAPVFTAEPGEYVLAHDSAPELGPSATTRAPSPTSSRRAALPAVDYLRARRELAEAQRRCAAAADRLRHPALRLEHRARRSPIDGPDKTTRMNALTKPFNALRLAGALAARRAATATACRSPCRSSACPGATPPSCAPPPRSRACFRTRAARATRSIASRLRSTSSSVVAQDDTLMRIAVRPCQTVPPHQQVPSACTPAIDALASPPARRTRRAPG